MESSFTYISTFCNDIDHILVIYILLVEILSSLCCCLLLIIAILRGSKHLWKTLKRKKLKNVSEKERVNYVWWCQKGGEIKQKQKLKLDKKQNPKLWEKGGEIKQKQRLED